MLLPMTEKTRGYLLVNFGGPRSLLEVEPFLKSLLNDQEVIRTNFPQILHRLIFTKIAKRRAKKVSHDYDFIGGKSPIFEDTEEVAAHLREKLGATVRTFHRYLPATHQSSLELIDKMGVDEILVFPFFPQFTYATTGSIATFFKEKLSKKTLQKLRWIMSYPTHPAYVSLFQKSIATFLKQNDLKEEETILLFSPHGLPEKFIETGDLYEGEVNASYDKIKSAFPKALSRLAYQSKFGKGEWLKPSTADLCASIRSWHNKHKNVLFVPLSFTSDHIETLFEVEREYMPVIKEQGLVPYRLPAIGYQKKWIDTIVDIINSSLVVNNDMLIRSK